MMKECTKLMETGNEKNIFYDIIFIEDKPSIIRTMPWCFQDNVRLKLNHNLVTHQNLSNQKLKQGHLCNKVTSCNRTPL